MAKTYLQVAVLAAVLLAITSQASASPLQLGGFSDAIEFPKKVVEIPRKVIGAVFGGNRQEAPTAAPSGEGHHHHHHHDAPVASPAAAAPSPAPVAAPTAAPAAAPTAAPTAATTAATTAAATATPAAATSAAPRAGAPSTAAAPTTAAPSAAAPTTAATDLKSAPNQQKYTDEELKSCRKNWLDVTNSTVNANLDILAILVENGGFPGQLEKGVKWEANKTDEDPNRWTYFFGDTDYATYIRLERGEVSSKTAPVPGTEPRELTGDIWWSPDGFCGKLRHAKYSRAPRSGARPGTRDEVTFDVKAEVCSIKDSAAGKTLRCSDFLQDRAPLGPALIATLVG